MFEYGLRFGHDGSATGRNEGVSGAFMGVRDFGLGGEMGSDHF